MEMNSNILYGKKLVACGDSFTEGDFSGFVDENGLSGKDSPVIYDKKRKMYNGMLKCDLFMYFKKKDNHIKDQMI